MIIETNNAMVASPNIELKIYVGVPILWLSITELEL